MRGRCLILTAKKGGMQLITVVLGAIDTNTRFGVAEKLTNISLDEFLLVDITKLTDNIIKIPIIKGKDEYYQSSTDISLKLPLSKDEIEDVVVKDDIKNRINAPMKKNEKIGEVSIYIDEEEMYSKDIYLKEDIHKKNIMMYLKDIFDIIN